MKPRAHSDSELSDDQVSLLANGLLDRRRELVEHLAALDQEIAARDDCEISDAAEAASRQEDRTRASGIATQHRQTITEIDSALKRLESGSYGVSEVSGRPIGFKRLSLIPWARTAVGDQA